MRIILKACARIALLVRSQSIQKGASKKFTWGECTRPNKTHPLKIEAFYCAYFWFVVVEQFSTAEWSYFTLVFFHIARGQRQKASRARPWRRAAGAKPNQPFSAASVEGNKIHRAGCLTSEKCVLWRCILFEQPRIPTMAHSIAYIQTHLAQGNLPRVSRLYHVHMPKHLAPQFSKWMWQLHRTLAHRHTHPSN